MWLLKDISAHFIPVLAEIVDLSFARENKIADIPYAIISTIFKKQTLDPYILENIRLVSNIQSMAKIAEMSAFRRLTEHINQNNLNETFQSLHKPYHFTVKTAFLTVKNDIAM